MARIDKVTQIVRAPAGTAIPGGVVTSVKLSGGSVVPAGTADALGVCCPGGTIAAGYPVGILLAGEIVEFGGTTSSKYYAQASGSVGTTTSPTLIGFTVEGGRLVVNM